MSKLDDVKKAKAAKPDQKIELSLPVQEKALGEVKAAIDQLYWLINNKEDYDFDKLAKQLTQINASLHLQPYFDELASKLKPKEIKSVDINGFNELIREVKANKPKDITIDLEPLEKAIVQVQQRITESSVMEQAPDNYQPVRRVIKVGNRLLFDDTPTPASGGGGGGSSSGGSSTVTGTVDIGSALPAGTNSIGSVKVFGSNGLQQADIISSGSDTMDVNNNQLVVAAAGYGYNGTDYDRVRSGAVANVAASTGLQDALLVGQYNASKPTVTDGRYNTLQLNVNGFLQVDLATLIAGEDQTNNRMMVEQQMSYSMVTSDSQIKSGAGFLHTITFAPNDATPTAGSIIVYDNTAESGTQIFNWNVQATAFIPFTVTLNVKFATGCYVGFTTTNDVNVSVAYR